MHKSFGGADNVFNRTFLGMSRTVLVVTMATPSPDSTAASSLPFEEHKQNLVSGQELGIGRFRARRPLCVHENYRDDFDHQASEGTRSCRSRLAEFIPHFLVCRL